MKGSIRLPAALMLLLPSIAHAQYIPPVLVAAALSPLLVLILVVVLGVIARSWRLWTIHSGLVVLWVVLFVLTAQTTEVDWVIWTPIILYGLHAVLIVFLIGIHLVVRGRARRRDPL